MSHLPPQAIAEFQALWKKHVAADLPPEQASSRANEVFAVLRLVLEERNGTDTNPKASDADMPIKSS